MNMLYVQYWDHSSQSRSIVTTKYCAQCMDNYRVKMAQPSCPVCSFPLDASSDTPINSTAPAALPSSNGIVHDIYL